MEHRKDYLDFGMIFFKPGSMLYCTVENGPGWSTSTARTSLKTTLPRRETSLMLRTYGAPMNTGELSFTSVTLKLCVLMVFKKSKIHDT